MAFDPLKQLFGRTARAEKASIARDPEQRETIHRLQVGFLGVGAMILLVGLANIIMNSVKDTQASAVPEAAPTVIITAVPVLSGDPLADAGVVPDLPADPEPTGQQAAEDAANASPAASASNAAQP